MPAGCASRYRRENAMSPTSPTSSACAKPTAVNQYTSVRQRRIHQTARGSMAMRLRTRPSVAETGISDVLIQTGGSMKSSIAKAVVTASALVSGVSSAQNGHMMSGGGMWGSGWCTS